MINGAFVILHYKGDNLVLNRRDAINSRYLAGTLELPGGEVETTEHPRLAAVRETYEETRIIIDPEKLVPESLFVSARGSSSINNRVVFYSYELDDLSTPQLSDEHTGFQYLNTQSLNRIARYDLLLTVRDALEIFFGNQGILPKKKFISGADCDTVILPKRLLANARDYPDGFVVFGYKDNLLKVLPAEIGESLLSYLRRVRAKVNSDQQNLALINYLK